MYCARGGTGTGVAVGVGEGTVGIGRVGDAGISVSVGTGVVETGIEQEASREKSRMQIADCGMNEGRRMGCIVNEKPSRLPVGGCEL